jgi:hypothetical protein
MATTQVSQGTKKKKPATTTVAKALNEETKAIVPAGKATGLLQQFDGMEASEWATPELSSQDLIVPKILAMQGLSKQVAAGEAVMGEFRNSVTGECMGSLKQPLAFLPFYMQRNFVVMKLTNGKWKFVRQVPLTAANDDHPFEVVTAAGEQEKWYRAYDFFVLLPNEIEEGRALPYILTFRSSSLRAGKKLNKIMYMDNLKAGGYPASMFIELSGEKTTNDKGTFVVMDVKPTEKATKEAITEAFKWMKTVTKNSARIKVDHSDLEAEAAVETTVMDEPESSDY